MIEIRPNHLRPLQRCLMAWYCPSVAPLFIRSNSFQLEAVLPTIGVATSRKGSMVVHGGHIVCNQLSDFGWLAGTCYCQKFTFMPFLIQLIAEILLLGVANFCSFDIYRGAIYDQMGANFLMWLGAAAARLH